MTAEFTDIESKDGVVQRAGEFMRGLRNGSEFDTSELWTILDDLVSEVAHAKEELGSGPHRHQSIQTSETSAQNPNGASEQELKQQRDFLIHIINSVPDQIHVRSHDDIVVAANDAFCKSHDLHRSEIVRANLGDLLTEELASQLAQVQDTLTSGEWQSTEHVELSPSDEMRIVSTQQTVFRDDGNDEYIVATTRDVTDARERESRLRVLASVFKGASEGVAILNEDGRIREANPAFQRMVDGVDDMIGKQLFDVFRCEKAIAPAILAEVASGVAWSGKATVPEAQYDSRSYWLSLSPSLEPHEDCRVIALVSDITELEDTQTRLRRQALHDPLTRLPNRRFFREHLEEQTAIHADKPLAVCFIDLDDFKHVNDTAGHVKGDLLLQGVGSRIRRLAGPEAFVARFGGDEFAIIMPVEGHEQILSNMLSAFREPFVLDDTEAVVGLSVGVTIFPYHTASVDALMCNADIAMYAAKSAGKNQVRLFDPKMQANVDWRHRLQAELRRAVSIDEISLWYQPKVCSRTGDTIGCEALARWKTPDGRFVSPGEFIPVAEQSGLIMPLGRKVIRMAAEAAKRWSNELWAGRYQPLKIAVNVSPNQLRHPRFVAQLLETLEDAEAQPQWFELEITENAMVSDVAHAARVIDELASLGFSIAIDDFGTGYSSLSYLKDFHIHTLKIDLSFIRDVTHDPRSLAVVKSIVSLGQGLDLSVVAEGVETQKQASVLAKIGCDILQGFHIAKPMPDDPYLDWLREQGL